MLQCVVYYIILWCNQLEGPELCVLIKIVSIL